MDLHAKTPRIWASCLRLTLIVSLVLLAACGGSDKSPTSPSGSGGNNGGGGNNSGGDVGDAATDTVTFFNSYQVSTPVSLGSGENFRVYKPQSGRIAVDYLNPRVPDQAVNVVTVTEQGEDVSAGGILGYTGIDGAPAAWFQGHYSELVRNAAGNYLQIVVSGSLVTIREYADGTRYDGTLVNETVLLDCDAAGLTGMGYQAIQTSVGSQAPPIDRTDSGYVTVLFFRQGSSSGANLARVLWLDSALNVTASTDINLSLAMGGRWCITGTSDGGAVVGADILDGVYYQFGSPRYDGDAFVFKVDPSGFLWSRSFDYDTQKGQEVHRIYETDSGNLLVVVKQYATGAFYTELNAYTASARIEELSPFGGALRSVMLPIPVSNIWDVSARDNGKFLITGTHFSSYYQQPVLFVANVDENFMWTETNVTP